MFNLNFYNWNSFEVSNKHALSSGFNKIQTWPNLAKSFSEFSEFLQLHYFYRSLGIVFSVISKQIGGGMLSTVITHVPSV